MDITEIFSRYGIDTVIIAVVTLILTGIIKMPIKWLANKTSCSKKITRFITFLPVILGFGVTAAVTYLLNKTLNFTEEFYIQWLSAVSLSLALYAFWEKFVPSENKILTEAEAEANSTVIEELKGILSANSEENVLSENSSVAQTSVQVSDDRTGQEGQAANRKKIIISNKIKEDNYGNT